MYSSFRNGNDSIISWYILIFPQWKRSHVEDLKFSIAEKLQREKPSYQKLVQNLAFCKNGDLMLLRYFRNRNDPRRGCSSHILFNLKKHYFKDRNAPRKTCSFLLVKAILAQKHKCSKSDLHLITFFAFWSTQSKGKSSQASMRVSQRIRNVLKEKQGKVLPVLVDVASIKNSLKTRKKEWLCVHSPCICALSESKNLNVAGVVQSLIKKPRTMHFRNCYKISTSYLTGSRAITCFVLLSGGEKASGAHS